jgi:hypothetical protein
MPMDELQKAKAESQAKACATTEGGIEAGSFGLRCRFVRASLAVRMGCLFGEKCLFCSVARLRSDFFAIRAG